MPVFDNYLNTVEAAEVLGFHYVTVERMCHRGCIPAKKIHNRWLIDKSELEKYLVYSGQKFDIYVNVVKAAEVLGFHWQTVEYMCRGGRIPAKKMLNRWLIDKSELEKYLVDSSIKTERIRGLGQKLKSARDQLGLSQPQFAATLGVSSAAVSRWEHGNRSPRMEHSQQILHWLQQIGR